MPARSRRKRNKDSKSNTVKIIIILTPLILIGFIFLLLRPTKLKGLSKIFLVYPSNSNSVNLAIIDKENEQIVKIIVPGNTQMDLPRKLGEWKVKSVWQLGLNEGMGGKLLAESLVKNLYAPVSFWSGKNAEGLFSGSLNEKIKFLMPHETNLAIGDRVDLILFAVKVKDFKKTEFFLDQTTLLKKESLIDGEEVYKITKKLPQRLLLLFADSGLSDGSDLVAIRNRTSSRVIADEIGEIIGVMGAKVALITDEESDNFDCEVEAKESSKGRSLAGVFGCTFLENQPEGNFDLEIKLGEDFLNRF